MLENYTKFYIRIFIFVHTRDTKLCSLLSTYFKLYSSPKFCFVVKCSLYKNVPQCLFERNLKSFYLSKREFNLMYIFSDQRNYLWDDRSILGIGTILLPVFRADVK